MYRMLRLKHTIVSIIFFFFVYDIQIKGLPTILSSRKWSLILLFLLSVIHYKADKGIVLYKPNLDERKKVIYKKYLLGITAVGVYALLIILFKGGLNGNYIDAKNITFFILYSIIAPLFLCNLFQNREELFKTLIFSGIVQSTIVYILFVSVDVRILFEQLFQTDARFGYTSNNHKVLGLGSGGAALSVLLFLSLYCIGYYILKEENIITNMIMYFFILIATLFTGRTGFFSGILLILIILLKKGILIKGKTVLKLGIVLCLITILLVLAGKLILDNNILQEKVLQILKYLKISEIVNIQGERGFLYDISKMSIPDISLELLYGSGYSRGFSATGINIQNDIGYIQRIFSLGIFFASLFYSLNFICFWKLSKKVKEQNFKFYYRILIVALFIFELKEAFFYYYLVPSMILLIGLIDETKAERNFLDTNIKNAHIEMEKYQNHVYKRREDA